MAKKYFVNMVKMTVKYFVKTWTEDDEMAWMIPGLTHNTATGVNGHKVLSKHGENEQMTWILPGLKHGENDRTAWMLLGLTHSTATASMVRSAQCQRRMSARRKGMAQHS